MLPSRRLPAMSLVILHFGVSEFWQMQIAPPHSCRKLLPNPAVPAAVSAAAAAAEMGTAKC